MALKNSKVVMLLSLLAIFLIAGIGTAKLLEHFAVTTATITVKPALSFSTDGINWQDAPAEITYELGQITAGETKYFDVPLYIRNNLPVEGSWDYVYFDYKYTFSKDFLDGLEYINVSYTTYESSNPQPDKECDQYATIDGDALRENAVCTENSCSVLRSDITEEPDKLGEGMVQKFCGFEIKLNQNTNGGTYSIQIEIIPAGEGE